MASFKKCQNGRWKATISMGMTEDGKRKMQVIMRDTLKECKQETFEIEKSLGKFIFDESSTRYIPSNSK